MNSNSRMMKGMMFGGVAAFVFIFLFEFVVHGVLMTGMYEATKSVWRPQAETNMLVMVLSQFLHAMAIAFFYPIVGTDKDSKKAIPFGVGLGLVMAAPQIATYCYLPIPMTISLAWAVSSFVTAFGAVFIIAKIFNRFAK